MTRKDAGFTLIEAMTVLAVIAVTLTLGLPAFGEVLQRHRISTTMHLISADLAMARGSAVMRSEEIVICPRTADRHCQDGHDWASGWLVFRDPDGNRQPDASSDILRSSDAPLGKDLDLHATRKFLRYQRDGRSAGTPLSVKICRRDTLAGKVVVSNLGRIRSERPNRPTPCFG
ncbi:GspH/FimT family pseudopilin [Luteimonas suaedae]|uniref:GspH/FimT family pseudopilin n=1 Tax=Luteimonas suaedae TaxID=2605430 RepID=UPI001659674C|nr:GspH/FimT family pseudopilin [Luteimonas suaedae]